MTTKIRRNILFGLFNDDIDDYSPNLSLNIYLSSTYSDTSYERDLLINHFWPPMRKRGFTMGVDVSFSDMQWGISNQSRKSNELDHNNIEDMTNYYYWIAAFQEIERCKFRSCIDDLRNIYFLALHSQK